MQIDLRGTSDIEAAEISTHLNRFTNDGAIQEDVLDVRIGMDNGIFDNRVDYPNPFADRNVGADYRVLDDNIICDENGRDNNGLGKMIILGLFF